MPDTIVTPSEVKPGFAGTGHDPMGAITNWFQSAFGGVGGGGGQPSQPTNPSSINTGAKTVQDAAGFGAATPDPNAVRQFISPLALQAYFANTIAPMLSQIQNRQQGAMNQFAAQAGNADPRQLASMQNVNNSLAGAAVAAPGLDRLMSQVNDALNFQVKAYERALRNNQQQTAGDLATQLADLLGTGADASGKPTS